MRPALVPFLAVVCLAGCSKLHEERTFAVDAGWSKTIMISPPASSQKLKIAMTSDEPVNVWVVLKKDVPGAKEDIDPATIKSSVLASAEKTKSATLDVTIPAKEEFWIVVNGSGKRATGSVKIDSQ